MNIEYKEIKSVRVGDIQFDTAIRIDNDNSSMRPVLRIYPTHDAPFYQEIILNEWSGLTELGKAIIILDEELDKMIDENNKVK